MKKKIYRTTKLPTFLFDAWHLTKSKIILNRNLLRNIPKDILPESLKDFEKLDIHQLSKGLNLGTLSELGLNSLNFLLDVDKGVKSGCIQKNS